VSRRFWNNNGPISLYLGYSCVRVKLKCVARREGNKNKLRQGLPDHVVMAQLGHVSPKMLKTYGHIRRQALNQAAAALEPNFTKATVAELVN